MFCVINTLQLNPSRQHPEVWKLFPRLFCRQCSDNVAKCSKCVFLSAIYRFYNLFNELIKQLI